MPTYDIGLSDWTELLVLIGTVGYLFWYSVYEYRTWRRARRIGRIMRRVCGGNI